MLGIFSQRTQVYVVMEIDKTQGAECSPTQTNLSLIIIHTDEN